MSRGMKRAWGWMSAAAAAVVLALVAQIPVGGQDLRSAPGSHLKASSMDLSTLSAAPPEHPLNLLFIHHSVGGEWLADVGPDVGENCINSTHPEGGGLRKALQQQGYVVHETSYGSKLGENTDLFDWLPKFRDHMPEILQCSLQDAILPPPAQNQIVMFKSCFPNNAFQGAGQDPGNPRGPAFTLANARATYLALLPEFQKQPKVLFICVTTPPIAPGIRPEPLWKALARKVLNKQDRGEKLLAQAALARQFANWLKAPEGWLKDYPLPNVAVFDYYDVLTGNGASDLNKYPTQNGFDSHPSAEGQRQATEVFVPFLNRLTRRAGLVP